MGAQHKQNGGLQHCAPASFSLSALTGSQQQYDSASTTHKAQEQYKHYPPVPSPTDFEPSAPPLPAEYAHHGWLGHQQQTPMRTDAQAQPQQQSGLAPGQLLVSTPKLEPQPWAINAWRTMAANTVGIARIDLRRPTFVDGDDGGNILFKRKRRASNHRPHINGAYDNYHNRRQFERELERREERQERQQLQQSGVGRLLALGQQGQPTGARLKIMRCAQLWPQQKLKGRPLVDFGVGVGYDLDKQSLHGIVRAKVADWLSLKIAPEPVLRIGGSYSPPGTRMALRLRYECPLMNLGEFWRSPARLMLRLDNNVGTGIHLSPSGIEFDERRVALGSRAQVRAGALLRFPRQLPVDPEDPDAFKLQVHRLTFKTQW